VRGKARARTPQLEVAPTTSSTLPSTGGLPLPLGPSGDEPKELQLTVDVEDVSVGEENAVPRGLIVVVWLGR
jgi:hypothetical protein